MAAHILNMLKDLQTGHYTLGQIKHAMEFTAAGDDCVAVEVFPPADDLLDSANIYHLWCWNPLRFRLPFEFKS